jgi:hydrogenase maturation protein HypF
MALAILHQALRVREVQGEFAVGFAGGVFQNRLLTERALALLQHHGFTCYLPEVVPVNDAGLCYGQVVEFNAMTTSNANARNSPLKESTS